MLAHTHIIVYFDHLRSPSKTNELSLFQLEHIILIERMLPKLLYVCRIFVSVIDNFHLKLAVDMNINYWGKQTKISM